MIFKYLINRYEVRRPVALIYLGLLDGFWWVLEKLFRLKKSIHSNSANNKSPQKILLVNGAHLGDLVISTAAIRRIKELNPSIQIGFIAGSWGSDLLKTHPGIDFFYPISHWRLNRSSDSTLSKVILHWRQWWAAYQTIRKERFDIAILLNSFFPNFASLLWLSRCNQTVGYVSAGGGPLLSLCLPKPFYPEQKTQLNLLDSMNLHGSSRGWIQADGSLFSKAIQDKLPAKFILLHPGTGNLVKEWPIERWITLGKILHEQGHSLVLTGYGERESALCKMIAEKTNGINLSNQISLNDWFVIIQKSDLVIGVDSAAGHIAAVLEKPFVGIYSGIGEVFRWTPVGNTTIVLNYSMPCSPCHTRPCMERPCLLNIEPSDVIVATHQLLSQ